MIPLLILGPTNQIARSSVPPNGVGCLFGLPDLRIPGCHEAPLVC